MIRTALFLLFTLLIVPITVYLYGSPLTGEQVNVLSKLVRMYALMAGICFLTGEITRNYSQVDKLWSIVPILYAWLATEWAGWPPRMLLMSLLITLWGGRLTFNFARRGGYTWPLWGGEEDYRWAVLRAKPGLNKPLIWSLFNLLFICYYQMGLILLFTLPVVAAMSHSTKPLGAWDGILSALFLAFLVLETVADQQQWNYQNRKKAGIESGKGFLDRGLWGIVRHPNYASEQAIWILIYGFSVVSSGQWINWSIGGCLLLLLLFKGSSDFSEEISAKKYPEYSRYQQTVGRFFPQLSRSKRVVSGEISR